MSKKHTNEPPRHRSLLQQFIVPIVVFVVIIVFALLVLAFGDKLHSKKSAYITGGAQISTAMLARFEHEYDQTGISQGPADAKVVVREFADYQCPACAAFAPTAERIREEYAKTGKVRFVFFDFPLNMHQNSHHAAVAARCVAKQGNLFWPYHTKLFAAQRQWSGTADPTEKFLDLAVETGVAVAPLKQCIKAGATKDIVAKSGEIARAVGVSSTPTVIIGRNVYTGVKSFESMQTAIESQLQQAAPAQ